MTFPERKPLPTLCLNPLKRVNSILTKVSKALLQKSKAMSQSPQTGQFNSYFNEVRDVCWQVNRVSIPSNGSIQFLPRNGCERLGNWKKKSQSPQTGQFNSYRIEFLLEEDMDSLNPLKRVNSILTRYNHSFLLQRSLVSQSPQTGQFNSYSHFNPPL